MDSQTLSTSPAVISSIFYDYDLRDHVSAAYAIKVTGCQLIKPFVSSTYEITTLDKAYILRIYPYRQGATMDLDAELELLVALQHEGQPIASPIRLTDGSYMLPLAAPEGERQAVLYTYAEGQRLAGSKEGSFFTRFGKLTAELHQELDRLGLSLARPPLSKKVMIDESMQFISQVFGRFADEMYSLYVAAHRIGARLDILPTGSPEYGICHGDLNSTNIHVQPDGTMTLFDFECCGVGWRAFDIASAINSESAEHTKLFLQGYLETRALTDAERESIPLFQAVQKIWSLGIAARRIHETGTFGLPDGLFSNTVESIRQIMMQVK
jgi:Ser/Thr protein kinase RdoA (MazF antagonist)